MTDLYEIQYGRLRLLQFTKYEFPENKCIGSRSYVSAVMNVNSMLYISFRFE